ncbi:YihY family inner membrane protein [candidate division KSB1 bacterium]|nr:YihY family inner membrane protein [candidate division KSB1 bacterium]
MVETFRKIQNFVVRTYELALRDIQRPDLTLSRATAFLVLQIRLFYFVSRAFIRDRLLIRASALVYATLLSIVPLLALSFSLLKAFGFTDKMEPTLTQIFQPLGSDTVQKIVPPIIEYVNNINVGVIGAAGFLFLFFSILSIINNIERAFNDIWQIKKSRSLARKISDYISVLLLGPVLVFAILGITASVQSYKFVQIIHSMPGIRFLFNRTAPLIASWVFFYFLLTFIPNTRVKWKSALVGAVIGGTLWQISNYVFAQFIVASYQFGSKAAIYAGLATLPLFLFWLYINWAIILLGAEISFTNQNLGRLFFEKERDRYSHFYLENMALRIVLICGSRFDAGKEPPNAEDLSRLLNVPTSFINTVVGRLQSLHFLHATDESNTRYIPAQSLDKLRPIDILQALRKEGINPREDDRTTDFSKTTTALLNRIDAKLETDFHRITILSLIRKSEKT